MSGATIFMCGDSGQTQLLSIVAEALRGRGHTVLRGPCDTPGTLKRYSPAEQETLIDGADVAVFTVRHDCSYDLMAGAKRLRGVCYPTIGVETLDLDAAAKLGIIVGHGAVRGNVVGMAESSVMLMLMLLYDVQTNIDRLASGQWRRPGHHGRQFEGKTVGLIGFGRIARAVAERLAPFKVRIITSSPRAKDLPSGVMPVSLDTLLRESDIVSVLTGLTSETQHLLDERRLALMKPAAYLINTARGAVVDETALISALTHKRIAGAALDTFEVEPLPADSALRKLDNVILTPHCVGHTIEGGDEFIPALIENVERVLRGELPLYCKNPDVEPLWRERLLRLEAGCSAA